MISQYHYFVKKKFSAAQPLDKLGTHGDKSEQGKEPANRQENDEDQARASEEATSRTIAPPVKPYCPPPGRPGGWPLIFWVKEGIVIVSRFFIWLGFIQDHGAYVDHLSRSGYRHGNPPAARRAHHHGPRQIIGRFKHGIALGATNIDHDKDSLYFRD